MADPSLCECRVNGIPQHLHWNGREIVSKISNEDFLYLRHKQVAGAGYGAEGIPGLRVGDQSANSELLNPKGQPTDVLFHSETGERLKDQIAKVSVADLQGNVYPNEKSRQPRRLKDGTTETGPADVYSIFVKHLPDRCMYPHCEIRIRVNDKDVAPEKGVQSPSGKTMIRKVISDLASRWRAEMLGLTELG
jgi:hypothetical protein